ncbi:MAG: glycerophosphodiester phosphodiesterase family protein [Candidatus Hydrogenedentes bacterium]|nr:glycerophosphodiester phosphodiesterase family protein [Candidatus Hydrogenedentota bacterium]
MTIVSLIAAIAVAASPAVFSPELPIKPPKHGGVYVMAHRGAHQGIPENTLAAYQKGIDLGVDFVEIDIRTTKDGKYVSCHNATVDSYTNGTGTGKVRDHTLEELRAMDFGSRVGPQFKGTKIPTFEEILNLCKGKVGIYLDFKDADMAEVAKIIKDHGMEHEVVWYLYKEQAKQLQKIAPDCIPMPDPGPESGLADLIKETHPRIIASSMDDCSKTYVETCHAAKAIVVADCMPNDPKVWEKAMSWDLDGLQTDNPAELIAWLDKNPKAKPFKP